MLQKLIDVVRPNVSPDAKITGMAMFLGKILKAYDNRLIKVEQKALQKGDKGDSGKDGKDGKDGKNGKDGVGLDGKNGKDGKDGKDGKAGKSGVSVVDSEIAADGHLVLNLSNGDIIDAGKIVNGGGSPEMYSVTHATPQIVVSLTAPPNPQPNDLWYDIT
jgi:hypothetical protein